MTVFYHSAIADSGIVVSFLNNTFIQFVYNVHIIYNIW